MNRRTVLKLLPTIAGTTLALGPAVAVEQSPLPLSLEPLKDSYLPLDKVTLHGADKGTLVVLDGSGNAYLEASAKTPLRFEVAGALGTHTVRLLNARGEERGSLKFSVDCKTELQEDNGAFQKLLAASVWTMMSWNQNAPVNVIRHNGRVYQFLVNWVFDHTLTLKGMKYYWPDLKDAVDFFAETQREDGMIWENCYPCTPDANYFDWKFAYGDFVRRLDGGFWQLRRAPVESHVEQFFVEALYFTWKATGDTEWMKAKLDRAIRALRYATSDPYRWSTKYNLMHRGFTIDTWDYTSDEQQKIGSDCVFVVYLGKSEFGVFFGDNTSLIAAARRLAEMLRVADRDHDAEEFVRMADTLQERLDKLSWNGNFYTHWIAENSSYRPDVGVDMASQVSFSNSYSLNRYLPQEKCAAITKTYQRIRTEMPAGSPGEFYGIYPPFQREFTQNIPGKVWEYMNGGVVTVVAAELAQGAFEHGFEEYAGDILVRQSAIADRYRGYLPAVLRGKPCDIPKRSFRKLPFGQVANADFGPGTSSVPGWTADAGQDLRDFPTGQQEFQGIAFAVIAPERNANKSCVILSQAAGLARTATLQVNSKAASFYFLHAAAGSESTVGTLTIRYADGTSHSQYIEQGKNIGSWWEPHDTKYNHDGPRCFDTLRIAWQRSAGGFPNTGVYVAGFDNPYPEREIESLVLTAGLGDGKWMILAATTSDSPVFFAPYDDLSTGIPDGWNAEIAWTILEGLAGVKDDGAAFSRTIVAPRWPAVAVRDAEVAVRYPASKGYCRYRYSHDAQKNRITVTFTGSGRDFEVRVLLPKGFAVHSANLDGHPATVSMQKIEQSAYAVTQTSDAGPHTLTLELSPL